MTDEILAAGAGRTGVQHSDLHRHHLLQTADGQLAAVLDFGASFVGSIGWDFALLHYYYGEANAERVAASYQAVDGPCEEGRLLAVVVGLYKMAKNPADLAVARRVNRLLREIDAR